MKEIPLLPEGAEAETDAAVFVSDASAEAERVAQALRARGYVVVDVPLAMLVARVAVQRPRVVVLDGDADDARETAKRVRELTEHALDVILLGSANDAPEGTFGFGRPVDVAALVARVTEITGAPAPPASGRPIAAHTSSLPPPSMRREPTSSRPPAASRHTPVIPSVSLRPPLVPQEAMSLPTPGQQPAPPSRAPRSPSAPLSAEVESLLHEAEERATAELQPESARPSPEEEIEAVLPADILASLDEPLVDEDVEEPFNDSLSMRPAGGRGSGRHTTATRGHSDAGSLTPGPKTHGGPVGATTTGSHALGSHVPNTAPPTGGLSSVASRRSSQVASTSAPTGMTLPPGPAGSIAPSTAHTEPPPPAPPTSPPPDGGSEISGSHGDHEALARAGTAFEGASHLARLVGRAPPSGSQPHPPQAPESRVMAYAPKASVLGAGEAPRALGDAIAARATGVLCFTSRGEDAGVERRIVLREGDIVTAASSGEGETLLAFLGARGDLPRESLVRLGSKVTGGGRHAGAALVAHGYLRQDQLWDVLRAHAEWVLARVVASGPATVTGEAEAPGRLRSEPSVFGATTGAAVFVEIVRRVIAPDDAAQRLGGAQARIAEGPQAALVAECALDGAMLDVVEHARGRSLDDAMGMVPAVDVPTVLYALDQLGVVEMIRPVGAAAAASSSPAVDELDEEAIRARVRARLQLVDEGDYFAVLGVSTEATAYEVRRAFLELRRAFDPSRILTPAVADLDVDVRKIVTVLEEAYEILRDGARRERYRRAIAAPRA